MRTLWLAVLLVVAVASLCLLAGCGDDESPKDRTAPTVLDTSPAEGATDVSPYPVVAVWFSEAMDPASIDTLSFYIEGLRAHSIAYDATEHKATLYPVGLAEADSEYDAHVTTGVTDAAGNPMDEEVVFGFATGPVDCEHMADRFEPNDVIAEATPVELDLAYPGLTSCGGAERIDHYRFSLTEAKKITVSIQAAWADTDYVSWKINYRRADGLYYVTQGTSVQGVGDTHNFHYTFLPGTYWVETGSYSETAHLVLYHLTIETSDPMEDDAYEDNDFPDEAKPIEPGLHEGLRGAWVDADYFSIDLTAGQTLTVTATEVTTTNTTRRLLITNALGGTYTGHADEVNPAVESWTATQTGKHLIKTRWWTDDVIYDLNVEVTP